MLLNYALCSKVKGFRPHGLLVYRLCLPPDTPIIIKDTVALIETCKLTLIQDQFVSGFKYSRITRKFFSWAKMSCPFQPPPAQNVISAGQYCNRKTKHVRLGA